MDVRHFDGNIQAALAQLSAVHRVGKGLRAAISGSGLNVASAIHTKG